MFVDEFALRRQQAMNKKSDVTALVSLQSLSLSKATI